MSDLELNLSKTATKAIKFYQIKFLSVGTPQSVKDNAKCAFFTDQLVPTYQNLIAFVAVLLKFSSKSHLCPQSAWDMDISSFLSLFFQTIFSSPTFILILFVKGVFSKPSGNLILGPDFCLQSQIVQILATCLSFNFAELCKV